MSLLIVALLLVRWVIQLYIYVLWGRFILDWVRVLNPRFRPKGIGLVLVEFVYTLTDPPINAIRKVLPPIRLGQIALDLGWMVTMFGCYMLLMLIPR